LQVRLILGESALKTQKFVRNTVAYHSADARVSLCS
jgi:hypothetical protein